MGRPLATDRLVAVATTRPGVDLSGLRVLENVQDVIDAAMRQGISREIMPEEPQAGPAELWTATTVAVTIGG